ncbi:GNAT family N-acetyltransferase [Pseudokineococcus sp. 1T1Z-3]|uniref:GNAT family N-acetyltransferase n=1 Tax=Pseudokineococcus sp. 1T1Z-3 TaxID=3132745 RepID=UPI0030A8960E
MSAMTAVPAPRPAATPLPALGADRRVARTTAMGNHPAGGRSRRAPRPSRALPRRSAPAPLPVREGLALARRPWQLVPTGPGLSPKALGEDAPVDVLAGLSSRAARTGQESSPALRVRGAVPADLPALAAMHGRCTGTTLLQRYRAGGRVPSVATLTQLLRQPLVLVVLAGPRQVVAVATAHVSSRPSVDFTTEMGVLVEDAWQARGVGTALARHVGASLRHLGYGQVVTTAATASLPLTRVMEGLGSTRHGVAEDGGARIASRLDASALDGLAGGALTATTADAAAAVL